MDKFRAKHKFGGTDLLVDLCRFCKMAWQVQHPEYDLKPVEKVDDGGKCAFCGLIENGHTR